MVVRLCLPSPCLCAHPSGQPFLVQFADWSLRGMAQVIMVNNPISGALILAALIVESPWQAFLGTLGLLVSTFTAVIIGMDRLPSAEVSNGVHGFNGVLVSLLIGVFSSAGDWYWWLLFPVCMAAATCTFVSSGLASLLHGWDLPVSAFPFNTVIILYLSCTGSANPYFPHRVPVAPEASEPGNSTQLNTGELLQGVLLGIGQIYACAELWPSAMILVAVFIFSPLLCTHALLGSGAGTLAGLSVASPHTLLYTGLSGFNGALGCMAIGGLFFTLNWKTHLLSIASGETPPKRAQQLWALSAANVGLPACSWAATLTASLALLLSGHNLSAYRIPTSRVATPERNRRTQTHRPGPGTESTV
uniref:Urea transporter n=1 Tax=Scleropages formosus TaxID=113540 RepID=A0A8C9WJD1_SCLFO